jgi:hypothetical protein
LSRAAANTASNEIPDGTSHGVDGISNGVANGVSNAFAYATSNASSYAVADSTPNV